MSKPDGSDAERLVAALIARLYQEGRLQAEVQRSRREFLGQTAGVPTVPGAADAAERRFCEWFLLERESEVLGTVPAEVSPFLLLAEDLPESIAGVFLVQSTSAGVVVAQDLQDDTNLELGAPAGTLLPGDLLVGRLWAESPGRWVPSTALAVIRPGTELARAFTRDLRRLDLERRLQQIELEHLLLQRAKPAPSATAIPSLEPLEHLEADLDRLLRAAGSDLAATDISQQIAMASRPGPVLGPLLDQMAFDTVVDLDRARALLLAMWNAHHADDEPPASDVAAGEAPGETLGERLVRTLDEGLAQKRDVAEIFAQLERMAGIEAEGEPVDADVDADTAPTQDGGDPGDEADEDSPRTSATDRWRRTADAGGEADAAGDDDDGGEVGDEPDDEVAPGAEVGGGDIGPLVEEYLWENRRTNDQAAAPLRLFVELQANAPLPHADLEAVTTVDVMRLLLHVSLGSAPAERASRVRTAFAEMRRFCQWAIDTQEVPLAPVLAGCQGPLLEQLDRLQAAGIALTTASGSGTRPGILQVEDVAAHGFGVRDDDGGSHWLAAPPAAAHLLRVGDLLLGAMQPANGGEGVRTLVGLVVVLPADAKALME